MPAHRARSSTPFVLTRPMRDASLETVAARRRRTRAGRRCAATSSRRLGSTLMNADRRLAADVAVADEVAEQAGVVGRDRLGIAEAEESAGPGQRGRRRHSSPASRQPVSVRTLWSGVTHSSVPSRRRRPMTSASPWSKRWVIGRTWSSPTLSAATTDVPVTVLDDVLDAMGQTRDADRTPRCRRRRTCSSRP